MSVRALVPLKRLSEAKSRLAAALPAAERRRLVLDMAAHVLGVVRAHVDETFLLTTELVSELGPVPELLDEADGLNPSLARAARRLDARAGDRLLVVFADLPLVSAGDLDALAAAAERGFAIAPDRHGVGVNAVGFRQPLDVDFCFGPDSRHRFEAEARRLGQTPVLVQRPGLGLDIDDADSLALYREGVAAGTRR
jgi:2-phospho-L-lactate guanylyltransferase